MDVLLTTVEWLATHGAVGVLALTTTIEAVVIRKLFTTLREVENARCRDMQMFVDVSNKLHEKVHKTIETFGELYLKEKDTQ